LRAKESWPRMRAKSKNHQFGILFQEKNLEEINTIAKTKNQHLLLKITSGNKCTQNKLQLLVSNLCAI
jgi:hypothetical protein